MCSARWRPRIRRRGSSFPHLSRSRWNYREVRSGRVSQIVESPLRNLKADISIRFRPMKILFLGDIVGHPGVDLVQRALPRVIAAEQLDLVIANAENASAGTGMTPRTFQHLR